MTITVPVTEPSSKDAPYNINVIDSNAASPDLLELTVVNCMPSAAESGITLATIDLIKSVALFKDAATDDYKVICENYPYVITDPPAFVSIDPETGNLVIAEEGKIAGIYSLVIQAGACTTCTITFELSIYDCTPKFTEA